jgi:ligand-binding sensor domain-containing protein
MNRVTDNLFYIFIVLLSGPMNFVTGQPQYKAYPYSVKDGISSEICHHIFSGKDDFVWISGDKGLNRYDGNSIYTFKHDPEDAGSIASNRCNFIFEDSKGRLWVNTDEGISLFNRNLQTFTNYFPDDDILPRQGISYTEMAEDNMGRIWMGGYYDVLIFDPETKKFSRSQWIDFVKTSLHIKEEKRNSISQSITKKNENELWILSVYGLFSVHTTTLKYTLHPNPEVEDFFAFHIVHIDNDGTLWIATYENCFYSYQVKTGIWKHYDCPPKKNNSTDWVINVSRLSNDSLLITKQEGMYVFNIKNQKYSELKLEDNANSPTSNFIKTLVKKDEIFSIESGQSPFVHYIKKNPAIRQQKINQPKTFVNNHSYITHSGKILLGDWEKNKVMLCFKNDCQSLKDEKNNERLGALQLYYYSKTGKQYFSTSQAVYSWNESKNQVINVSEAISQNPVTEFEFRNMVEDDKGNLYVRERNNGLYVLKVGSLQIEYVNTGIKSTGYSSLYYDKLTKKLWLATEKDGLYIINPENLTWKNYPLSALAQTKKGFINDISGDHLGNVYLLMPGKGMMHIHSSDMKAKLYTTSDGLISDAVRYGLYGSDGLFWFTTESGLMAFQFRNERFISFENEPESNKFNYRIFESNTSNIAQNLYPDNILIFDKSLVNDIKIDEKLYLKEITVFGKKYPSDTSVVLNYDKNNISFLFGYKGTIRIPSRDFQYSINNQSWQSMQNMSVQLFNLQHGVYNLGVRYKYEPNHQLNIYLKIKPPWWKTLWFYSFLIVSLIFSLILVYRWRVNNIIKNEKEKNQLQKRIAEIEMSALRAQMNPHFIFNCLSSINRFILTNDTEAASAYLTKFSRLIRMILDGSRSDFFSLAQEIEALRLYIDMESMRFMDSFEWYIHVEKNVQVDSTFVPPLLLQPYVENAIWHGLMQKPEHAGIKKLSVEISKKMNQLIICITDNGIGRQKALELKSKSGNQNKSYGIEMTGERLQLMEKIKGLKTEIHIKNLHDKEGVANGTKVIITINE